MEGGRELGVNEGFWDVDSVHYGKTFYHFDVSVIMLIQVVNR